MSDTTVRNALPFPTCGELAEIGFFNKFSPEALEAIAPLVQTLSLPTGQTLFHHGEPHDNMVQIICSGLVRQSWPDGRNRERHPGEMLGISSYLDGRPHGSTVTTVTDCEFLLVPARELRHLEATSRSVSDAMDESIADNIHHHIATAMDVAPFLNLSVAQAMQNSLVSCGPDTSLHQASLAMRERQIGSIVIMDDTEVPMGLLTCAHLYSAVLGKGMSREDKVISADYQPPHQIPASASLQQAEHLQERKGVKYLLVTRDEKPVGILSQTDILRAVTRVSPSLLAEIRRAGNFIELGEVHRRLPRLIADIRGWNRGAMATIRVLNDAHRAMMERCIALVLAEMIERGRGTPPAPFALLLLGSGGRGEMLLTPDQDNAILLGDRVDEDPEAIAWFADFTDRVNERLAEVGYPLCPGGIMARNPPWRKSLSAWRRQFAHVIAHPTRKAARWANIILDPAFLYGDEQLLSALRQSITEQLRATPRLLRMMVEDDAEGRPPLGFFDRLITTTAEGRKHHVDLKRNALRLVADAARAYAWRAGVGDTNTVDRFQALARHGVLSREFVKTTVAAYDALLDLYLDQRLEQTLAGRDSGGTLLDYDRLTPHEQELLRISLRAVKRLQKRLQNDFEIP
uniref:CBS domain-containing protein n=1 Tax=Candidatus Kentrum sp. DK TaxID=2126562 RepID=A0A450SXA5_9GAMM|nr:MAG: CBS domain-containing protein [Candidatus Kentron sp. DK]VFJ64981.1 MAG: CBS domain-containing protein [Candidatus Kentron sp. DK]